MRPNIKRVDFKNATDTTLLQLIAESSSFAKEEPGELSESEAALIKRRLQLCELLNRIEFTIESYGILNFLAEYAQEISDLEKLSELLEEFGDTDAREAITKTLQFYKQHHAKFVYLRSHPSDYQAAYDKLHEEYRYLEKPKTGVWYHIPLRRSIAIVATYVRENPDEFCVDEHGKSFKE